MIVLVVTASTMDGVAMMIAMFNVNLRLFIAILRVLEYISVYFYMVSNSYAEPRINITIYRPTYLCGKISIW